MTAATITTSIQNANSSSEVVVLTATDDETYVSKKFTAVSAAIVSDNDDTGTPVSATFTGTGNTVTITWTGCTDELCTLEIWGHEL